MENPLLKRSDGPGPRLTAVTGGFRAAFSASCACDSNDTGGAGVSDGDGDARPEDDGGVGCGVAE